MSAELYFNGNEGNASLLSVTSKTSAQVIDSGNITIIVWDNLFLDLSRSEAEMLLELWGSG